MKIAVISPLAAIKPKTLWCVQEKWLIFPVSKRRPIINNNLIFGVDVIVALVAAGSSTSTHTKKETRARSPIFVDHGQQIWIIHRESRPKNVISAAACSGWGEGVRENANNHIITQLFRNYSRLWRNYVNCPETGDEWRAVGANGNEWTPGCTRYTYVRCKWIYLQEHASQNKRSSCHMIYAYCIVWTTDAMTRLTLH